MSINPHEIFARYFKGSEAIAYLLSKKLAEGNICIPIGTYGDYLKTVADDEVKALFIVSEAEFEAQLKNSPHVTRSEKEVKPFVLFEGNLYLHRYFTYESRILARIEAFNASRGNEGEGQIESNFAGAIAEYPGLFEANSPQLKAARNSFVNPFSIITGGPGTGKTTTIAKIMVLLLQAYTDLRIALAAPTGKAAARMKESLVGAAANMAAIPEVVREKLGNLQPVTLHRLLGSIQNSCYFRYNHENPLPFDLIVVDESSMIDAAMMAKLFEAVAVGCRIILLGDKDQLASVEAGSIFGDLCRSAQSNLMKGCIAELTKSHRFNPDKGIGFVSRAILAGESEKMEERDKFSSEVTIDTCYESKSLEEYALHYRNYIEEEEIGVALQKINDVRILCAVREGDYGIYILNRRIEALLQQRCEGFMPVGEFYHNRPIMITRNNYELNVHNGDVGIIREVEERGQKVPYAFFEGSNANEVKKIPASLLPEHETVFAMTIHKSQGSEFTRVAVILPEKTSAEKILSRELFYTAVTRAKEKVLVQSAPDTFNLCFARSVNRSSGIVNRITEYLK
ncbi:MAG: exodeoxyribonuclease V subunit alpha [Bacteroidales bacterium]